MNKYKESIGRAGIVILLILCISENNFYIDYIPNTFSFKIIFMVLILFISSYWVIIPLSE